MNSASLLSLCVFLRAGGHLLLTILACSTTLLAQEEGLEVADVQLDRPVEFRRDIRPILRRNCLACHNESETEGELVLESVKSILAGGDSGPAVIPKDAGESLLFQLAAHRTEPYMPPVDNDVGARTLTAKQLGLLKLWIDQGATKGTSDVRSEQIQWKPVASSSAPTFALDVSRTGRWVAAGRGNEVTVYGVTEQDARHKLVDDTIKETHPDAAHLDVVQSLAFSPGEEMIVSGGYRCVKVWQRGPAEQFASFSVDALGIATSSEYILTFDGHRVTLRDLSGEQLETRETEVLNAWFVDATNLMALLADGTLQRWSCPDLTMRQQWHVKDAVLSVGIRDNTTVVAVQGADGVTIRPLDGGDSIAVVKPESAATFAAFSPDSRQLGHDRRNRPGPILETCLMVRCRRRFRPMRCTERPPTAPLGQCHCERNGCA